MKNDRELETLWTHTYSELNCKKCLILSPSEAIDTAISAIEQLGKMMLWYNVVWYGDMDGMVWAGVEKTGEHVSTARRKCFNCLKTAEISLNEDLLLKI